MWQFLCGFGAGVYVGTVYDCKPTLQFVKTCIKNFVPEDAIPINQINLEDVGYSIVSCFIFCPFCYN